MNVRIVPEISKTGIKWRIQKKGWFFWADMKHTFDLEYGCVHTTISFSTIKKASEFLSKKYGQSANFVDYIA